MYVLKEIHGDLTLESPGGSSFDIACKQALLMGLIFAFE